MMHDYLECTLSSCSRPDQHCGECGRWPEHANHPQGGAICNRPYHEQVLAAWDALLPFYGPREALTWLLSEHKLLGGAKAFELLGSPRAAEVFAIIDGLASGTYA